MPPASGPTPRKGYLDHPYTPGDSIPAPEAIEGNDTAWNEFSELARQQEARFAPTAPASLEERTAYAATAPMGLPTTPDDAPRAAPAPPQVTLDQAMVEARRNNRVCPRPEHWLAIYALLPGRKVVNGKHQPAPPITGAAWKATPSLPKRLCFREHLEWAERNGSLELVLTAMKKLDEKDWLHMGED
jgi:hypothetical protein